MELDPDGISQVSVGLLESLHDLLNWSPHNGSLAINNIIEDLVVVGEVTDTTEESNEEIVGFLVGFMLDWNRVGRIG